MLKLFRDVSPAWVTIAIAAGATILSSRASLRWWGLALLGFRPSGGLMGAVAVTWRSVHF
jgi:predicted signal transduction protein with EAL and GGDEF domain